MSLRASAHTGVAIRFPAEKLGKSVGLKANSLRPAYSPKVLLYCYALPRGYGLPRRFAPRNDSGGDVTAPQCPAPADTWHVFAHLARQTFLHPRTRPSFCMSLRTSAHTGVAIRFPRREAWQVGCCLGKFVALSRIRLRCCFLLCATAGEADCPVAPLLAMTCRNMQLPAVATAWCHGKFVTLSRIRLRRCFLLCATAGEADCHVAPLLAMTCRNMRRVSSCTDLVLGKFAGGCVFALSTAFRYTLPQGGRIVPSLYPVTHHCTSPSGKKERPREKLEK